MSLVELKQAIHSLPPDELAELVAFIRDEEAAAWDQQIDRDFAEDGRLHAIMQEVREDIRKGKLEELP